MHKWKVAISLYLKFGLEPNVYYVLPLILKDLMRSRLWSPFLDREQIHAAAASQDSSEGVKLNHDAIALLDRYMIPWVNHASLQLPQQESSSAAIEFLKFFAADVITCRDYIA